jgi:hypothetical protein
MAENIQAAVGENAGEYPSVECGTISPHFSPQGLKKPLCFGITCF